MTHNDVPPDTTDNPFLRVALAARGRGFDWVTPVRDKKPRLIRYNTWCRSRKMTELRDLADDFPDCEVGIVMRRGERCLVWDIDGPGVLERMEHETGMTLPETYTVLSRPDTAPHKRHIFFLQTPHSIQRWTKEVHLSGRYDIIGVGAGGQVVAEGQLRPDTGEIRTGNGVAPVPIPDWLVDWLVDIDIPRMRKEVNDERKQKKVEIEQALSAGEPVPKGVRTLFLEQLALWLVKFRMERQHVYEELCRQCKKFCEGGIEMVDTKAGRKRLRAIAFNPKLRAGDPRRLTPAKKLLGKLKIGQQVTEFALDAKTVRVNIVRRFPDTIVSKEAYRQLGLNPNVRADQMKFLRDMGSGGFVCTGGRRADRVWKRQVLPDALPVMTPVPAAPLDSSVLG